MKSILLTLSIFICASSFSQTLTSRGSIKVKKVQKVDSTLILSQKKTNEPSRMTWLTNEFVNTDTIYPEYNGGDPAYRSFINKNIIIPYSPRSKGIIDYVSVSFFVEEDGSLSEVKSVKEISTCRDCDEEVVRLVKLMPKWKPATLKSSGKIVRCRKSVDISVTFLK